MKVAFNHEMKNIDISAIEEYEISKSVLMENAGKVVADSIIKKGNLRSVSIICGIGNNGGDGFVAARHLYNKNIKVTVFVIGNMKEIKNESLNNLNILRKLDFQIENIKELNNIGRLEKSLKDSEIVIDGVFGTGFRDELSDFYIKVFEIINKNSKYILSIDIPSGVNGNSGFVSKGAIFANQTICFSLIKYGNVLYPGSDNNGNISVEDIGIPKMIIEKLKLKCNIINEELIRPFFPERKKFSYKGDFGKLSVIAGSTGLSGAAILTCKGALRSGMGVLKLYIPESLTFLVTHSIPEVVTIPIPEVRKGVIGINHIDRIIKESEKSEAIAIGPGCGNTGEISELVRRFIEEVKKPMVIDADGLNGLSKNIDIITEKKKADLILTPHLGEMSRLTGLSIEEISKDIIGISKKYALKWGVVLVLKGARTIVASPNGDTYININGNSGMATAGSGDVLTGIIGGLIAQGLSSLEAALLGVYLHGRSGDYAAEVNGKYSLLAGDIVEGLVHVLKEMSQE